MQIHRCVDCKSISLKNLDKNSKKTKKKIQSIDQIASPQVSRSRSNNQMDRESQSLAINYIVLVLLLMVLWVLYTNVSTDSLI